MKEVYLDNSATTMAREQADVAWRSLNDGVMHACGHDVHTAVLMGALQELNRSRDFEGTLLGLFGQHQRRASGVALLARLEEPEKRRWCWPKSLSPTTTCGPW